MNDKELFNKLMGKVNSLNDEHFSALSKEFFNGKNSILRLRRKGSSIFDSSWITTIEDCLYELGEIINNPREVTAVESNVVPIELAKKVNGESVQHLASHTQFIKDINEFGEVIPGKILSHSNREELHTYENKFIATFVRRLVLFIEKRYEFIKKTINLEADEILYIKNQTIINDQEVEIETKVTFKKQMEDDASKVAREYISRIELMREYITYYYNSSFMKELKNEKDVRKPILQTNIIRKNPLYHKCYETFLFIERFDSLGVNYHIDEDYQEYTDEERKNLSNLLVLSFLALEDEEKHKTIKESHKSYKPKILTSIDDEKFTYGDILKGPIEFVRIDQTYKDYLAFLAEKDNLPKRPTAKEKEYYADEYLARKNLLLALKEIDKLIARVVKEIAEYEKEVERLIALREEEEAEEARRKLEELRRYYDSLLEKKRQEIIAAAINMQEIPVEEEPEEVIYVDDEVRTSPAREDNHQPESIYHATGKSRTKLVDGHRETTFYVKKRVILPEREEREEVENETTLSKQDLIYSLFKKYKNEVQDNIFSIIPGQFIVKTNEGYYVNDNTFVENKLHATVFVDFNIAKQIKTRFGGKVIKL